MTIMSFRQTNKKINKYWYREKCYIIYSIAILMDRVYITIFFFKTLCLIVFEFYSLKYKFTIFLLLNGNQFYIIMAVFMAVQRSIVGLILLSKNPTKTFTTFEQPELGLITKIRVIKL